MPEFVIEPPYYPIVYVRGYAMRKSEREETFHDTYYGFAATSVEKRQTSPEDGYLMAELFEGQLIRFMKNRDYGYADATNTGLIDFHSNPSRSIWISRFYDDDFIKDRVRNIEAHAQDLGDLIINRIPARLLKAGISEESLKKDYKVILIAHSMGGLVCRTLIQNLLTPVNKKDKEDAAKKVKVDSKLKFLLRDEQLTDPSALIHRLVTIATPHKGIDMGQIPDFLEDFVANTLNPNDSGMFREERMRSYLKLGKGYDIHSLGDSNFPVKRCLCIIGSDYASYGSAKNVTGSFSDGLVKQDNAYVVAGPKPKNGDYTEANTAFYANVHRSHSGYRGIVNSAESYENIQRFLFGNMRIGMALTDIAINIPNDGKKDNYYYDFEFTATVRGTGVYLHRREQDPCENAIRRTREQLLKDNTVHLHTGFLNSKLRNRASNDPFSRFLLKISVQEYRVEAGFFWDHKYPARQIYAESLEIGVMYDEAAGVHKAEYRWQSEGDKAIPLVIDDQGDCKIPLRAAAALKGTLFLETGFWPDTAITKD